ncbi:MAG: eS25 family ribosomal protein [Asgard group archaeon]|nr:eS25 family ribosomal protein [Asgard group archaeon]
MSLRQNVNKRKGKWGRVKKFETIKRALIVDKNTREKMLEEIPKQRIVTPTSVCEKYQVRMHVAKKILKELEAKGEIAFHDKTNYTEVYTTIKK